MDWYFIQSLTTCPITIFYKDTAFNPRHSQFSSSLIAPHPKARYARIRFRKETSVITLKGDKS